MKEEAKQHDAYEHDDDDDDDDIDVQNNDVDDSVSVVDGEWCWKS